MVSYLIHKLWLWWEGLLLLSLAYEHISAKQACKDLKNFDKN